VSGIAGLYNEFSTEEEKNTWAFTNASHHEQISAAIYRLTGVALPSFLLDPMDVNSKVWLQRHQTMHQNQNAILGINGFNLLEVDLSDEKQRSGWVFLHGQEHYLASNILGIG